MKIKYKAYAKINLTLKVLGKRSDGYHEIETVMQSLELHDELYFESAQGVNLSVEGDAPKGRDNLILRAVELLQEYSGCDKGANISLIKRIPMAAGLAGGSTNAAATLLGLNELWGLNLNLKELMALGEKIGSDVPFCLVGGTVLARGKGEILTPLPDAPEMGVVLIKPPFGISTAEVYENFASARLGKRPSTAAMISAIKQKNIPEIAKNLANDLEYVSMEMYPELKEIKKAASSAGALGVLMSGSGPTIFALTDSKSAAVDLAERLNYHSVHVIVTGFKKANKNAAGKKIQEL